MGKRARSWDVPVRTRERKTHYGWFLRSVIAGTLFAFVYGAHLSGTLLGTWSDRAVKLLTSTQTDFSDWGAQLREYGKPLDTAVFQQIKSTLGRPADPLRYMVKPINGVITSPFGWRMHPVLQQEEMHTGIDINAAVGTPVHAAAEGRVKNVTESSQYGKMVIVEHSDAVTTVYAHLSEVLVSPNELVSQGQVIARAGKTGITNGPHLHFEVREKNQPVDPMLHLQGESGTGEGK